MPQAAFLFIAQATFAFGLVVLSWVVLHRRLGGRWSAVVWGGVVFLGAQGLRTLLLTVLALVGQALRLDLGAAGNVWFNLALLSVTAGVFEEVGRYAVLRFAASELRGWRQAVMFGAGHGGVEALLLVGLGSGVVNSVLLLTGETLASTLGAEERAALERQLAALRGVSVALIVASLVERAFAVVAHVSLSLLVMRAVEVGQPTWLWAAVGLHAAVNLAAGVAMVQGGVLVAEVVIGAATFALLVGCSFAYHRSSQGRRVLPTDAATGAQA